jgi:hypothetical protein
MRRLQYFFFSRRNLLGMALALGGLTLYAFGILAAPAWIPITAGLYAIGYLLGPGQPQLDVGLGTAQGAPEIRAGLDKLLSGIRGKVADDLYAKAWAIRESILATLEVEGVEDETDPNVYLIRQTALSYLPEAFATYLRMPRLMAERRRIADGRTPHEVLLEQLDLMDRRLHDVADDIARHDSDKLLANGRFLAEKFGSSAFQLEPTSGETTARAATPTATGSAVAGAPPGAPAAAETPAAVPSSEAAQAPEAVAEEQSEAERLAERERVH